MIFLETSDVSSVFGRGDAVRLRVGGGKEFFLFAFDALDHAGESFGRESPIDPRVQDSFFFLVVMEENL